MKPPPRGPTESTWLYALAGALLVGGPLWHYLFVNRYPFSRPEAILLPLGAALLGAGAAAVAHRIGGLVEHLVFGVLVYVFLDWQFDLEARIPTALIAIGCVALPYLVRSRRAALACITLGAFDLASLPRPSERFVPAAGATVARPAAVRLPLLVHIILDEQWGVGGLEAAGDSATAAMLRAFYLQRGFEVYEGAYSRSSQTRVSIPAVLSLGGPPGRVTAIPGNRDRFRLHANAYFEKLRAVGYTIHVYQTTHLDFCHSTPALVASCRTGTANSIANIGYLRGSWKVRAMLVARYFLNLRSHAYRILKRPPDAEGWRRSSAGRGLASLAELRDAIAGRESGARAFFVHVLLPHRPLEVDSLCRAYANPAHRVNELPRHLSDSSWRAILLRYAAQDRCVHGALSEVLAAVDRTVGRDGAIVIIHGDHGPRMHRNAPEAMATRLDTLQLNSKYSTLLAIRRPRVPAASHPGAVPIQDFLWELFRKDFAGAISGEWAPWVAGLASDSAGPPTFVQALTPSDMIWARPKP